MKRLNAVIRQAARPGTASRSIFYLTALLFLIFDVEIVFLYPWAAELRQLGIVGFIEAAVFIAILVVGLIYAWQRGALDFD